MGSGIRTEKSPSSGMVSVLVDATEISPFASPDLRGDTDWDHGVDLSNYNVLLAKLESAGTGR